MLKRIVRCAALMMLAQCGTRSLDQVPARLAQVLDLPAFQVGGPARLTVEPDGVTHRADGYEARFSVRDGALSVRRPDLPGLRLVPVAGPLNLTPAVERAGAVIYSAR